MGFSDAAIRSLRYNDSLRRGIKNGYFQNKSTGTSHITTVKKLEIDTSKADKIRRKLVLKNVIIPLIVIFLFCIVTSCLLLGLKLN